MTPQAFRKLALALPDVIEAPHFELASFRAGGKIFATLSEKVSRAMVKLTLEQQEMLTTAEPKMFQRIPNAWGDKGATWLYLEHTNAKTAQSALGFAFENVRPKAGAAAKKPRTKA